MTSEGIAEGYLSECEDRVRTLEWQLSEATKAVEREQEVNRASASIFGDKLGALQAENAMLRQDVIDLAKGYEDRILELRALLERIREWDHMDTAADGRYWRGEIDAALVSHKGP